MILIRLLAPLLLAVLAYWGLRRISQRYSLSARQFKWLAGMAAALLIILVLIVMGRLPLQALAAPFLFLLTFLLRNGHWLMRILPMLRPKYQSQSQSSSQGGTAGPGVSAIKTSWLAMELTHSTGAMDGEVQDGQFAGTRLSDMSLDELLILARECRQDADSIQLLEAYLDRMFPDWRAHAEADADTEGSGRSRSGGNDSLMTEALALEILGLGGDASREDITAAHRRLMQKMHPDRGGSDYLAQRINQARDFLLRNA